VLSPKQEYTNVDITGRYNACVSVLSNMPYAVTNVVTEKYLCVTVNCQFTNYIGWLCKDLATFS